MTENQKNQPVQSIPGNNQKQNNPANQGSKDKQNDASKKPSDEEDERESTEENKEQEDSKHPHKQGAPVSSQNRSKSSSF